MRFLYDTTEFVHELSICLLFVVAMGALAIAMYIGGWILCVAVTIAVLCVIGMGPDHGEADND